MDREMVAQKIEPMTKERKIKLENDAAEQLAQISSDTEDYFRTVPPMYRMRYAKAVLGSLSPRKTIQAKCEECCNYENVVDSIKNCPAVTCPLFPLRPHR
jgi:hypothetical protein